MAREPVTEKIGEHTYTVTMLPATRGWKLSRRVGKIILPALGVLMDETDLKMDELTDDEDVMAKIAGAVDEKSFWAAAIKTLLNGLGESECEYIIKELAASTRVYAGGESLPLGNAFELHFQGEMKELGQWMMFALKVQLGFFTKGSETAATSPSHHQDVK